VTLQETGVWRDALETAQTLAETASAADAGGAREVARVLARPGIKRVIATGNGASYYASMAFWLASLAGPARVEVVPVPGGLVARRRFTWREGDVILAFSSSGEFRDVIEAVEDARAPRPYAVITANEASTLGREAGARALVTVRQQRAVTHTQAYCGAVLAALAVWAELSSDEGLRNAVREAPEAYAQSLRAAWTWVDELRGRPRPTAAAVAATGPGWAAALEAALLLKEIARLPAEGVETREGATSALMGLRSTDLFLLLPTLANDPLLDETEALARGSGVPVLRSPTSAPADPRVSPILTFAAPLALSVAFGLEEGLDVDRPAWVDAYYATARKPEA
jgi:fructoselysine-6-P-deglycase FrlB-like protein